MAVDSAAKRFAMLGFGNALVKLFVVDAAVSTADRVALLDLYNGITLAEPALTGSAALAQTEWLIAFRHAQMRRGRL